MRIITVLFFAAILSSSITTVSAAGDLSEPEKRVLQQLKKRSGGNIRNTLAFKGQYPVADYRSVNKTVQIST